MAPFNNKETLGLAVPNVSETRAPLKDAITIHSSEVPQTPPEELDNIEVRHDTTTAEQDLFISSPYTEHHHRLDLSTLDTQPALLARALETLNPASLHYATSPYNSALAWEVAIGKLQELCAQQGHTWTKQTFYAVAFYSKLKEGIDRDLLHQLDKESHAEAAVSGGLLKYWFGVPNEERRNLATCESICLSLNTSPRRLPYLFPFIFRYFTS